MDYLIIALIGIGVIVWYIRPLYNFFAKRKYFLLNNKNITAAQKLQSSLPSVIFYTLLISVMVVPAFTSNLINSFQSGSVIVLELVLIFFLTRYDKRQTKYKVDDKGLHFKNKSILWENKYNVKFKGNIFLVLHKPRFIVTYKRKKIVVPVLSSKINLFINKAKNSYEDGLLIESIYKNIKNYYITNEKLAKTLNKNKQI